MAETVLYKEVILWFDPDIQTIVYSDQPPRTLKWFSDSGKLLLTIDIDQHFTEPMVVVPRSQVLAVEASD